MRFLANGRLTLYWTVARSFLFALALFPAVILPLGGCGVDTQAEQVDKAIATLREADRQYDLRRVGEARKWVKKALVYSTAPDVYLGGDSVLGYRRGVIAILYGHGDYDELVACMNVALANPKLKPKVDYLQFLGDSLNRLGHKAEAQAAYARLVVELAKTYPSPGARTPGDRPVLLSIADAQWLSGDIAAATKSYESARRLYPDHAADASNSQAYLSAEDGIQLAAAEKLSIASIKDASARGRDDELGEFQDTLGWIYYKMWLSDHSKPHLAQAIVYLELGASALPGEPDCQFHLAKAYEAAGRVADASIEYARVANMHTADPAAQKDARRIGAMPQAAPPESQPSTGATETNV
ncbi:MAG: hypothetical protein P4L33_12665 [Capsulimonadaceae bacterium]|nr:hypothetical protein [Capsulimonadaceae bacterium]